MNKKWYKNVISFLLVFFVLTAVIFVKVISASKQKNKDRHIVKEIVDERTENKKVFLNSDGTYTAQIYEKPIHFKNGDNYEEIDNTLVLSSDSGNFTNKTYKNKASNIKVSLNEDIGLEEPVSVGYENYKISFKPIDIVENTNVKMKQLDESGNYIDEVKYSTGNEQQKNVYSIEYNNDKFGLRYTPTNDGLKEEIILNSYEGKSTFEFLTNLKGLDPVMDEIGQVLLLDKVTKEKKGVIPKPFMFDSAENKKISMSVNIKITKEKENDDLYRIVINADKEFLENTETQYPVIIDPTVTFSQVSGNSEWEDTYVSKAKPSANFNDGSVSGSSLGGYVFGGGLSVGNYANLSNNLGITRSYIKLKSLPNLGNAKILSAKFIAYTNNPTSEMLLIGLHQALGNWSEETLTWSNAPLVGTCETSVNVSNATQYSWYITNLVRNWYSGASNYGFVLKAENETNLYYKLFYSKPSLSGPRMEITYGYPPNSPTGLISEVGSLGVNTSKGYVNLSWNGVSGATGYKIAIFNGRDFEYFDVGNVTSWTSLDKKIWPTFSEIQSGRYQLHHDGYGEDLPNDPVNTYINSGGNYQTSNDYLFSVIAYNQNGESNLTGNRLSAILPDSTSPSNPSNINLSITNNPATNTPNNWNVSVGWSASQDMPSSIASGIQLYKVRLYEQGKTDPKAQINVDASSLNASFPLLDDNKSYYVTVQAFDVNGNYTSEKTSNSITTGDRTPPTKPSALTLDKNTWDNANPIVSWKGITDYSGLRSVQYSINGLNWIDTGANSSDGSYTIDTTSLSDGIYSISVRGVDNKNNVGEAASVKYYKDTIIPETSILEIEDYQEVYGSLEIKGTANDLNISNWVIEYGDGELPKSYSVISTGINNVQNQIITNWNISTLSKGIYTLRLRTSDIAGNTKIASVRINVLENSFGSTSIKTSKKEFNFIISASKVMNIGQRKIHVAYNPDELDVIDLCSMTSANDLNSGKVDGTDITIESFTPGTIILSTDISTPEGKTWSGVINGIKFKSKVANEVGVSYTIE